MQFSYVFLAAVAACGVAAKGGEGKNDTATMTGMEMSTKSSGMAGMAGATGSPKAGGKMNGTAGAKSSMTATSSSTTTKQSTAAAPGLLLAQAGGMVTVAGLGAAFAVFM